MKRDIKVSVVIYCFNQEKYIEQAVKSVLMQKVDFPYEIIISDDASTDSTPDILKNLDRENENIRLFLHPVNLGGHGKSNFKFAMDQAIGEYLVILEGDDYWTSENKLQFQSDFLDKHPSFSAVFHNAEVLNELTSSTRLFHPESLAEIITTEDLIDGNIVPTTSVMFRRKLFGNYPDWFDRFYAGDWLTHLLNSLHGNFRYFHQTMSVYRHNVTSNWQTQNRESQLRQVIEMYRILKEDFRFKDFSVTIARNIQKMEFELENLINARKKESGSTFIKRIINGIIKSK